MKFSYTFRARWARVISEFSDDIRLEVYGAAMMYLAEGVIAPGLSAAARMALAFIIDDVQRSRRRAVKAMPAEAAGPRDDSPGETMAEAAAQTAPAPEDAGDVGPEVPSRDHVPDDVDADGEPTQAPGLLNLLYGIINKKVEDEAQDARGRTTAISSAGAPGAAEPLRRAG